VKQKSRSLQLNKINPSIDQENQWLAASKKRDRKIGAKPLKREEVAALAAK
jgi:hypothetical protein